MIIYAKAGDCTQSREIREVFSKGDVAIGENGVTVFYYNDDGIWVSQEFDEANDTIGKFADLVGNSSCVRFLLDPKKGVQLSLVSDRVSSGNLPTFFFPRLDHPMSDEEFRRRVFEYGPPQNADEHAIEIIRGIDPSDEDSVKEGLLKWILALTITDDNVFDFSKVRNWVLLRENAEAFWNQCGFAGEFELSEPQDGNGFGFAEFRFEFDINTVLQIHGDSLQDFLKLIGSSEGIILETATEQGHVFLNLSFGI